MDVQREVVDVRDQERWAELGRWEQDFMNGVIVWCWAGYTVSKQIHCYARCCVLKFLRVQTSEGCRKHHAVSGS
jgi:hypothetical protein